MNHFRFETRLITPEDAKFYLQQNEANRRIKPSIVALYAADMLNNRWKLSPDPIVITNMGRLLNGQHRMTAVIRSGVTIPFTVAICEDVGQCPMDIMSDFGTKRSASDYTDVSRRIVDVSNLLFWLFCHRAPSPGESVETAEKFAAVLPAWADHSGLKPFTQASNRLGWCARAVIAPCDYVAEQYYACLKAEYHKMNKYVALYYRALQDKSAASKHDMIYAGIRASDPQNAGFVRFHRFAKCSAKFAREFCKPLWDRVAPRGVDIR